MRMVSMVAAGMLAGGLVACGSAADVPEQVAGDTQETSAMANARSVSFETITGEPLPMSRFDGEVVLVVNTASKCGFTPQYEGLQALHEQFESEGFSVLGVPSNDFGGQEPGTEAEIKTFCELNFGVDFPLTSKVHAVGPEQHEFWTVAKTGLGDAAEPKWNFHKVLVGRDGTVLSAYPSATRPSDSQLVGDIEAALEG
ncbi:MAG: glutathione peroxidase [Henriciella sp.]|uniref:glutathione peroxidase n=1 Tax=Henriciella sp. TaxID=1968823 RepID=UPI0032EFE556